MGRWLALVIAVLLPAQLSPASTMPAATADLAGMIAFCGAVHPGHHDQAPARHQHCNTCCVAAAVLLPGTPFLPMPASAGAIAERDVSRATAERFPTRFYASRAPPSDA